MAEVLRDTINIQGLAEVGEVLKTLPLKMKERVVARAMLAAANVGVDAVRSEAPVGMRPDPHPGRLRDNIRRARRKRNVPNTQVQYVVYVNASRRNPDSPYYWYFIEFGYHDRAGHFHAADPFMTRGFNASVQQAGEAARDQAADLVIKEVTR